MRWMWIDRITQLDKAKSITAIKNISLAEEVVHDHFAAVPAVPARDGNPGKPGRDALPVLPNSLIIEGMAQTAGIMVGHANDFKEKVILAKIGKAIFTNAGFPGYTLKFSAVMDTINPMGASTSGTVTRIDPATGQEVPLATIELMFSHIDQNRSGLAFPEHNFVFTDQFMTLLRTSGF